MTGPLWELLFKGAWITVQLMVYSAVLAAAVAFGIGLARTSRLWIVRFLSGAYVEIFRGTSALVLMFWLFFALPLLGWQLAGLWAGTLALGLSYGAYGSEVVRGAVQSVSPAQREAAVALNFTPWQRMRKVILPQAVPEMMPSFCNLLIELLKGTALVSLLGVGDVSFAAYLVRLATQDSAQIYSITLVIYFVLAFGITRGMKALERRTKANLGLSTVPPGDGPRTTAKVRKPAVAGGTTARGDLR